MKVKDIIKSALVLISREDILHVLTGVENGEEDIGMNAEQSQTVETLLYCFNAVEDELARFYFPLVKSEVLSSGEGVYAFSEFSEIPVKLLSVKSGGKSVKYEADTHCIRTKESEITVTYRYAPAKKDIDGDSAFSGAEFGERLVASGAASEYCLINGEVSSAHSWESVYRGEIDRLQRKSIRGVKFPPRRWV